jgi:CoA:oxalate CoA-transferase
MRAALALVFATRPAATWREVLDSAGIPNGHITVADVLEDRQIAVREKMQAVEHPDAGSTQLPSIPIKLSTTPGAIRRPAPVPRAHTGEVLA